MDFKKDRILNEKGGRIMRKRQGKKLAFIFGLLALGALILTFQLGAIRALAGTDDDSDGFYTTFENDGITLPQGMTLAAYPSENFLPKCAAGIPRDKCVDSTKQDLFVIIQRATTTSCPNPTSCGGCTAPLFGSTNIASPRDYNYATNSYTSLNPLALVYPGAPGATTLPVTTHELINTGTSQMLGGGQPPAVPPGWYAVKIVENLDPCSNYMGLSKFGVPNKASLATVWPEKIKNWINNQCSTQCFDLNGDGTAEACYTPDQAASFLCKNGNSSTSIDMKANPDLRPLYYEFIQNIVSHEASHMMKLAYGSTPSGATSADHHYTTLKGVLMEQSVLATVTKDNSVPPNITVTLYISKTYTKQDQTQHKLK
jgi:hypothetical protein